MPVQTSIKRAKKRQSSCIDSDSSKVVRWYQRVTAFNVSFGQDGIGSGWAAGEDRGRGAGEEGGWGGGVRARL